MTGRLMQEYTNFVCILYTAKHPKSYRHVLFLLPCFPITSVTKNNSKNIYKEVEDPDQLCVQMSQCTCETLSYAHQAVLGLMLVEVTLEAVASKGDTPALSVEIQKQFANKVTVINLQSKDYHCLGYLFIQECEEVSCNCFSIRSVQASTHTPHKETDDGERNSQ